MKNSLFWTMRVGLFDLDFVKNAKLLRFLQIKKDSEVV